MKFLITFSLTLFCVFALAFHTEAQTTGGRIAVINTDAFSDERAGITKYVNAVKTVNTEFAPAQKEIEALVSKLQTLEKEINAIRSSGAPADQQAVERKVEEYDKLQRDAKFKTEDAKTRYERRFSALTSPLNQDIGLALREFGKQKGFAIILDPSRDTTGLIVSIPDEKIDVTAEFITFYNSKP